MKTEKNRTAKKLYEWMWFIITLLPFIICLFTAFNDGFFTQQSLESALEIYGDYISEFFSNSTNSVITDALYHILNIFNDVGDPIFVVPDFAVIFGVYLISVEFVRLIVDLLLWVPRFLQKQLNKGVK